MPPMLLAALRSSNRRRQLLRMIRKWHILPRRVPTHVRRGKRHRIPRRIRVNRLNLA